MPLLILDYISTGFPWWVTLIGTVTGIGLGVMGALPWKSTAKAANERADTAEAERNLLRETRDRQQKEIIDLNAKVKVLEAKTDLNGLRDEFRKHTEQDLLTANQQIAATQQQTLALEAVKETLRMVQEQMKK